MIEILENAVISGQNFDAIMNVIINVIAVA